MSISLQHRPTQVLAWHLAESVDPETERTISAPEAIFTAIAELSPLGWRGAAVMPNGEWVIEFNSNTDPTVPSLQPTVGDWLVLDAGLLRKYTDAEITELFEAAE